MRDKRISASNIVIFLLVFLLLSIVTPIGDVIKERTDQAVSEVSRYYTEDAYATSLGQRLAMWGIAINVWEKQPLLGNGPGNFDDEIIALQEEGQFIGMDINNSVHNIYFQSLVMSGIVGFLALMLAVIIMPVVLFYKSGEVNREGALTGFIVVVSFAIFGLSESWTLRLPAVSIFLVYMVVVASHIHLVRPVIKN
jgi:O-antigen ligase